MAMTWTPAAAHDVLIEFCKMSGLQPDGARLVSFRQTALYHLSAYDVSLRIYAPHEPPGRGIPMLECARWLERHNFPAVRPSTLLEQQPVNVLDCQVSLWQWISEAPRPADEARQFGRLLRRFHDLEDNAAVPVFPFDPMGKIASRIERLRREHLVHTSHLQILDKIFIDLQRREPELQQSHLGSGMVHGDAIPSNGVQSRDGMVLIDLDSISRGPREWDLVPQFVYATRLGRGGRAAWLEFLDGYGIDESDLPSLEAACLIKQFSMTVVLCLSAGRSPKIDGEIERRLESWAQADDKIPRW
jgi:Ser/Thr protein kinase RdoA (MazF antagonist)